jgi:TnpA family transposase
MNIRSNENDLLAALSRSKRDLQQRIDRHFNLVGRVVEGKIEALPPDLLSSSSTARSRERELKEALRETIGTLERTRKAFKSKTLEALRKKLTQVLIDLQ